VKPPKYGQIKLMTTMVMTVIEMTVMFCEHDNEPFGPVRGGEFLYYLSNY
jgi:hypothetical protein